jgi:hypothetical protein
MPNDLDTEIQLHQASIDLITRTPDAETLEDVARITGRPFSDLLAEETGVPRDVVERIIGSMH